MKAVDRRFMRTKMALKMSKRLLLAMIVVCSGTPAAAQIGDAAAALNKTLRKAQRFLQSNPGSGRNSTRRNALRLDDIPIPPLPARSPVRTSIKADALQPRVAASQQDKPQQAQLAEVRPLASPPPDKAVKEADRNKNPGNEKKAPPPDVWSEAEILAAQQACKKILTRVDAVVEHGKPIKKGPCGEPAPVRLIALKGKHTVRFKPAATLNCSMVLALDTWIRRGLQPMARKHLGASITTISVMSSYSCRNAYGRKTTNLSEHGKANALDIGGFYTDNGALTELASHWGPTQRDIIAAAQKARQAKENRQDSSTTIAATGVSTQTAATATRVTLQGAPANSQAGRTEQLVAEPEIVAFPPLPGRRPSLRQRYEWAKKEHEQQVLVQSKSQRQEYRDELNNFLSLRKDLGGAKPKDGYKIPGSQQPEVNRAAFLRGAHRTACRIFGTVLGPEANDAHRDHFHVDLALRKHRNYCR